MRWRAMSASFSNFVVAGHSNEWLTRGFKPPNATVSAESGFQSFAADADHPISRFQKLSKISTELPKSFREFSVFF
jgi:hypothetical protein